MLKVHVRNIFTNFIKDRKVVKIEIDDKIRNARITKFG